MRNGRALLSCGAVLAAALLLAGRPAGAGPRYANGFPADPGFFPIGVWMQSPRNATAYRAMGINTFVGLYDGPTESQLAELAKAGMFVTAAQNQAALQSSNGGIVKAWLQPDEPDNAQPTGSGKWGPCIAAAEVAERTARWQARDPSRPVMINFGRGVVDRGWPGRGQCSGDDGYYGIAARGAGVVSFDYYPVANTRPEIRGRLEYIGQAVCNLRRRAAGQEVWAGIETTAIGTTHRVTPAQLRSEVWMALIHGAAGIYYFVHEWNSGFREDGIFRHPETVAAAAAVDRTIARLAPVLYRPEATVDIGVAAAVPVAAIARRQADALYVFAAVMQDKPAPVRFMLPGIGEAIAAVIDEDRAVRVADGVFEDAFDGYGVHLYRVALGGEGRGNPAALAPLPAVRPCGPV